APTGTYTLSLHAALPIWHGRPRRPERCGDPLGRRPAGPTRANRRLPCGAATVAPSRDGAPLPPATAPRAARTGLRAVQSVRSRRSEEHTSELQSRGHLVC